MKNMAKKLLKSDLPLPFFMKPLLRAIYRCGVYGSEAFLLLRKWLVVSPIVRSITECGSGLMVESIPYIRGKGRFVLGHHVQLSGKSTIGFSSRYRDRPELIIGNHVFIGHGCSFAVADKIEIGDYSLIAAGVRLQDNDGHPRDNEDRRQRKPVGKDSIKRVTIGKNVWIGSHSVILKGITIGDNAIVGAASVVTKDVEAGAIVAGNPARVISPSSNSPDLS